MDFQKKFDLRNNNNNNEKDDIKTWFTSGKKNNFKNYILLFPGYQEQEVVQFHHTSCNNQILIN